MASSTALPRSRAGAVACLCRDLLKLSKYRLSGLVALTAGCGYALRHEPQSSESPSPAASADIAYYRKLGAVTAGTWLSAACANTLNQMYEHRSDALMARTRLRPLPSGRLSLLQAGAFAAATGLAGVAMLVQEANETSAALAAANVVLYAGIYTPLKPISAINTWVGAVVGALPPMLGWAAASGGKLSGDREKGAWALGSMLFLWQIPHFHALAVVSRADYAAAGLQMLAVTNPVRNAAWAKLTAAAMVPLGAAFVTSGVTSGIFGWEAALLGMWMYRGAARMALAPTSVAAARPLFKASIFHLPLCMSLMMAHRVPYNVVEERMGLFANGQQPRDGEIRFHQPWEIIAPFPFLPVPMGVPAVVLERER